jgi:hypothetical protein
MDDRVITYRVGTEANPDTMLLSLAEWHGLRDEVQAILEDNDGGVFVRHVGLGELLRRQRETRGYKVREIHARSNISKSQLNFYESGFSKNPGLRTIQALSYGYRLPFIRVLMASLYDINPRMNVRKRSKPQ